TTTYTYDFAIFVTTDGGTTWTLSPSSKVSNGTNHQGYDVTGNSTVFVCYANGYKFYKSDDKGNNWTSFSFNSLNFTFIKSISLKDNNSLYITASQTSLGEIVLYTNDLSSTNWNYFTVPSVM